MKRHLCAAVVCALFGFAGVPVAHAQQVVPPVVQPPAQAPARAVSAAQSPASTPASVAAPSLLFAVDITLGAAWDAARPAHEQAYFKEHSANLRRLREQGALLIGARYGDKGFLVLQATSLQEAHAMMHSDPAIGHGVFAYVLHEFNVFYPGAVQARRRQP